MTPASSDDIQAEKISLVGALQEQEAWKLGRRCATQDLNNSKRYLTLRGWIGSQIRCWIGKVNGMAGRP